MTARLRYEQCCANDGCLRPARHAGICTACYMASSPAVRATADLLDRLDAQMGSPDEQPTEDIDARSVAECAALEALLDLPWAA